MILDVRVWKKKTPAGRICTSNLLVHGFSPTGTINLFEVLQAGKNKNQIQSK
jgi:hypothetical protein